ncbi:hypothetical protein FHX81_1827 [Saccharothrix saharensis]|uniref:Uncharacterized protein n=1 Tax=Saccharothrix saharensis TaxID=571190 RepID=A0A543J9L9_9PSEU|nr:hypothetical protein FHX81_1827 [Saccharothrix saharensis]
MVEALERRDVAVRAFRVADHDAPPGAVPDPAPPSSSS